VGKTTTIYNIFEKAQDILCKQFENLSFEEQEKLFTPKKRKRRPNDSEAVSVIFKKIVFE